MKAEAVDTIDGTDRPGARERATEALLRVAEHKAVIALVISALLIVLVTMKPGGAASSIVAALVTGAMGGAAGSWLVLSFVRRKLRPITDTLSQVLAPEHGDHHAETEALGPLLDSAADRVLWLAGRYVLLTNNIGAAVIISGLDGRAIYCNPFVQALFGHSPQDFYLFDGDLLESLVVADDRDQYRRSRMITDLGEPFVTPPYRVQQPSGLTLWVETRLVPVLDEDEEIIGMMGVSVDVTGTVNRQRQIEESNRDLGDFAYMVSHDLKAPIFTIKGMTAALEEDHGKALGEDGRALLSYVVGAASRLEQLVASVVEYSSIATKELQNEQVDLNETMRTVVADFGEQIRTTGAVIRVEGELPTVHASSIRIYQVFANLLGNALKYRDPGRTPHVVIRGYNEPGASVVELRDNGRGIPANRLEDIFRPFHRAHGNEIEGSGIGLACVKKIIDKLGGTVRVASVEGTGSTFTVSLPRGILDPRQIPSDLARLYR